MPGGILTHLIVHSIIFGDMGPATSPNEPLFFLHHANVDRAWAKVSMPFPTFASKGCSY